MTKSSGFTLAEVFSTQDGRKNAFTLAEVLITLGIIGVVAAMTMPTLINQTNGAQYKAAYKKALSALSQAVTLNVALDGISFAEAEAVSTAGLAPSVASPSTVGEIIGTRMNVVKATTAAESGYGVTGEGAAATSNFPGEIPTYTCTTTDGKETCTEGEKVKPNTFIFLNDGIMFAFDSTKAKDCKEVKKEDGSIDPSKYCYGVIDVNGLKGPNKVIIDAGDPTDIYPVLFYDQTILPASEPAKAVLYGK